VNPIEFTVFHELFDFGDTCGVALLFLFTHCEKAGKKKYSYWNDCFQRFARLPFFGRAYSTEYGQGGGIEFEKAKIENESFKVIVAGHVDTAFPVAVNFHVEVEDIVAVSHVEFVFDVI